MNPFDETVWADRIQQTIGYRQDKFDKDWKEIKKYVETRGNRFSESNAAHGLLYSVNIPHVKINTQRKVALLSGSEFFPTVESDAADLPNHETIVRMALRWGWRQARADSVLTELLNDFITLSIAGGQVYWDKYALEGRGAPKAVRKDMASIYFDPNRRQADVNIDCRWILDRQMMTLESARAAWPEYFGQEYTAPAQRTVFSNGMKFFYENEDLLKEKDGYVDLARVEFVNIVDGKKRIYQGIFDLARNKWVVNPEDNNVGRYTYFFMGLPLRSGHAYPDVDILPETEMSDLINGFLSLYVEETARTASPTGWVKTSDEAAKRSIKDPNINLPGSYGEYDEEIPKFSISPRATKALEAAMSLKMELEQVGMMPSVMTGNAPQGVRSGRAIESLKESASTPMKTYSLAQYEAGVSLAGIIFHLNRHYLRSARFLTIQDDKNQNIVLPVNIAEQSQEFTRAQDLAIPDKYMSETATVMDKSGQTQVVPRMRAAQMQADNPELQVELTINDIAYGNAEVGIEIKPRMSHGDKVVLGQNLIANGTITPYDGLRMMDIEGAEEMVARADERNQKLQAGEWVLNTPVIAAMYTRPDLFQMISTIVQDKVESEQTKQEKSNARTPNTRQ